MVSAGRKLMAVVYIAAGVGHFAATRFYEHIMPAYLPAHRELVLLSGAAEVVGGVGLLLPATRRPAAWGLAILLVAVFPANLWMVQHPEQYPGVPLWASWLRLPLQVPLLGWAWWYTRHE